MYIFLVSWVTYGDFLKLYILASGATLDLYNVVVVDDYATASQWQWVCWVAEVAC